MGAYAAGSTHPRADFGFFGAVRLGKQILNSVAARAAEAADRSRFAALPVRYLDDAGMTAGERAAVLGYEEPVIDDAWRVVASHL
jgi:hypothetical protein